VKLSCRNVIPEYIDSGTPLADSLVTYPILTGIPKELPLGKPIDVQFTSYGFRSVTGVEFPFDINHASIKEVETLLILVKKELKL
jgi:radical SAM superfamily enzyme with C-terminal helix-hairpin-helix motif